MGNMSGRSETFGNILEDVYKHPAMQGDREVMFKILQEYEGLVFTAHQALLTGSKVPDEVVEQLLHFVFELVYLKRRVIADKGMYAASYDVVDKPMTTADLDDDSDSSEDSEEFNSKCDILFPNSRTQENVVSDNEM